MTLNVVGRAVSLEDGGWYKFRSVGDNLVIGVDGSKLICMVEKTELDQLQLFRSVRLSNGKYRIVSKCPSPKSDDSVQVWDYLSHRDLLMLKKQSPTDRFTQNWSSELVAGYNSIHLIQSGQSPMTQKCIKNMGVGKQIQLIEKTAECIGDTFTRWYLELHASPSLAPSSVPAVVPVPVPVPIPIPILVPVPVTVPCTVPEVPSPEIVPMEVESSPCPAQTQGFEKGRYKIRSLGDNNVMQLKRMEGDKLSCICTPESKELDKLQTFLLSPLENGKFCISGTCGESEHVFYLDYEREDEKSVLILRRRSETESDKLCGSWSLVENPLKSSQYLIEACPCPDAPESDSHKSIKNMGEGNCIELVNESQESENYIRWSLEPQTDEEDQPKLEKMDTEMILDSPIPSQVQLPLPMPILPPTIIAPPATPNVPEETEV